MERLENEATTLPASLSVPAIVVAPGAAVKVTVHVPLVPVEAAEQLPVVFVVDPPKGVTFKLMLMGAAVDV